MSSVMDDKKVSEQVLQEVLGSTLTERGDLVGSPVANGQAPLNIKTFNFNPKYKGPQLPFGPNSDKDFRNATTPVAPPSGMKTIAQTSSDLSAMIQQFASTQASIKKGITKDMHDNPLSLETTALGKALMENGVDLNDNAQISAILKMQSSLLQHLVDSGQVVPPPATSPQNFPASIPKPHK